MPHQDRRAPGDDGHVQAEQDHIRRGLGRSRKHCQRNPDQRIGGDLEDRYGRRQERQTRNRIGRDMDDRSDPVAAERHGQDRPAPTSSSVEAFGLPEPDCAGDDEQSGGDGGRAGEAVGDLPIAESGSPPQRVAGNADPEQGNQPCKGVASQARHGVDHFPRPGLDGRGRGKIAPRVRTYPPVHRHPQRELTESIVRPQERRRGPYFGTIVRWPLAKRSAPHLKYVST